MKKNLSSLLLTTAAFCGMALSPAFASAASHEKSLGVGGGYATHNHSGYGKIFFQYSFKPFLRIAPEIGYVFKHENSSGFEAAVDMHFPFRVARGLKLYPLAGVAINNWSITDGGHVTRAGFNLGGGVDLYFTPSFKIGLQGKYSLLKDTDGGFFDISFGYVF